MRATWLLGGAGTLLLASGTMGAGFTLTSVVNSDTVIDGGLSLGVVQQIVVGNGGLVAMHSVVNVDHYIYKSVGETTTLLAGPNEGAYGEFRELAISPSANIVTYEAADLSGNFALFQRSLDGGSAVRVDATGTNTAAPGSEQFGNNHYQVNDSGVVVYKYLTGTTQNFSTAIGTTTIATVSEGDGNNLTAFNVGGFGNDYRRQVVTQNGSVVFYAETANLNQSGIYRMDPSGDVTQFALSGISSESVVRGASDNAVLYTTVTTPEAEQTIHLHLKVGENAPIELASYSPGLVPQTSAMTQQNRIAFYDPGSEPDTGSLKYYDATHNVVTIATEGVTTVTDGGTEFTIKALSFDTEGRRTAPLVNDNGIVVFDAIITPDGATDVQAYLAWDTQAQSLQVIVKADLTGQYADIIDGQLMAFLMPEVSVNVFTAANDVLKDALSEDNWFAFSAVYLDEDFNEYLGVFKTHIPEPATVTSLALVGAGALLRRRRVR